MSTALLALPEQRGGEIAEPGRLPSILTAMDDLKAIRTFVANEMRPGLDYGAIPGIDKPTLLLPGAQKVGMLYNTRPAYTITRSELGNGHMECLVQTDLVSRSTGTIVASGFGSCSTMEKKYRWRSASRTCPDCGQPTILKSKDGRGFFCWAKKGGCGANFRLNDARITGQDLGQVENPDIYDVRNTVLKMGMKRSLVSAAMSLGCMAELFTQDLDDVYDIGGGSHEHAEHHEEPPAERQRSADRRGVNEEFKGQPAPPPPPVEPSSPQVEPWGTYIARTLRVANDAWQNAMAVEGVDAEKRREHRELANEHSMVNYLVSRLIELGKVTAESVARDGKPDGPRDGRKAKDVVLKFWASKPASIDRAVLKHLAEKDAEKRAALGMPDPYDDGPSTGGGAPAAGDEAQASSPADA